jgi:uncharacterized repeat protein (TIGR01451 family)
MRSARLTAAAAAVAAASLFALPQSASAAGRAPVDGTIDGFSSGDFVYLNLLDTEAVDLAQVSVSQTAAAVSNKKLQTGDTLDQLLYDGKLDGKNAYGHAAGVSLNLGQGDNSVPQAQLTIAEAASPPRSREVTNIVEVPAAPLLTATVQPDVAEANTRSLDDFCILGAPLSQGTSNVADAQLVPAGDAVAPGFALVDATGEVLTRSTEKLVPNGHGTLGLSSSSALETAGITLFKGIEGAETTIKVVNPITLDAVAGGFPGTATATFGDEDGDKPVLSIRNGDNVTKLTLEQLIGEGAVIDFNGLIKLEIGLDPTTTAAADGTKVTSVADLVKITVIGDPAPSTGSVGGPLGDVLNPVLEPVLSALDDSGLLQAIDQALADAGLSTGVDFRLGHFEASSEVPEGGIECGLPVKKTVDDPVVQPGDEFTYTITVDNPYDCTLTDVKVDDRIEAQGGVEWEVLTTRPAADTETHDRVVWNDIGDIEPGGSASVEVDIAILESSSAGKFIDHAKATASCGTGGADGGTQIDLVGNDRLDAPEVKGGPLPNTGSTPWLPVAATVLVGVALVARWAVGRARG